MFRIVQNELTFDCKNNAISEMIRCHLSEATLIFCFVYLELRIAESGVFFRHKGINHTNLLFDLYSINKYIVHFLIFIEI